MKCSSSLPRLLPLLWAAAACSSSTGTAPAPTGNLTVTITGAGLTTPAVVVTGPGGYNKTITATETLGRLALGSYTIVADTAVGRDSVIGSIIDTGAVAGSPAAVTAGGAATVTVSYATKYRVGGMWAANNASGTIPELGANQLRASGHPVPAETLYTALTGPSGLALDANGNMWVSSYGASSNTLEMYTTTARNEGGNPTRTIVSSAISIGENITFDAHGDLWVADCHGQVVEFTPGQLTAGGSQTPAVAISGGTIVKCPWSLVFDSNGNLWVGDYDVSHVVEYTPALLSTSGTPAPADTIGSNGGWSGATVGVAFDTSGNLWVGSLGSGTFVEFTPAQLAAGGAPVPHVTVTLANDMAPYGMAFDDRGTLWLSDANTDAMHGLTQAQLSATGSVTPAVTDTISLQHGFSPEQPLFDPYATAPGVSDARVHSRPSSLLTATRQ
jgi:streptogramin lyase